MLKNIKQTIKELAKKAVIEAEKALGSKKGKEKKEMAIKFITNHLPVPTSLKLLVSLIFSSFIDDAVEFAVEYMEEI